MNLQALMQTLERAEGRRHRSYDDRTGVTLKPGTMLVGTPTCGVGHNLLVPMSDPIIDALLVDDINAAVQGLDKELPWWRRLDDTRQAVLAEMAFQLGLSGLLAFAPTLRLIEHGEYHAASERFSATKWWGQCPARARRLARWLATGDPTWDEKGEHA